MFLLNVFMHVCLVTAGVYDFIFPFACIAMLIILQADSPVFTTRRGLVYTLALHIYNVLPALHQPTSQPARTPTPAIHTHFCTYSLRCFYDVLNSSLISWRRGWGANIIVNIEHAGIESTKTLSSSWYFFIYLYFIPLWNDEGASFTNRQGFYNNLIYASTYYTPRNAVCELVL